MRLPTPSFALCLLTLSVNCVAADSFKLPFTCKEDDIQWAGMTCSVQEQCPVYLELSSIVAVGQKLFAAGNIHSAQVTLYSVLLRSDDGGAAWKDAVDRARGESLDHIQFADFETGWVSGQRAVPLPGDPFLLITHDGGRTWNKSLLLPEGGAGFIQHFHFDSATSGKLVIDRGGTAGYQLFETSDGGDTWKSSGQPRGPGPVHEEETTWRLRPEPGAKALAVEHLSGEKWVPATSLAIQIGSCGGS